MSSEINNLLTEKILSGEGLKIDKPLTRNEDFVMLFVENHFLLQTLSPNASKILIGVLNNILDGNIFIENSSFRQFYKGRNNTRTFEYQMSHQTYNKAFDELVNKKILININEPEKQEAFGIDTSYISYSSRDNLFLINPSIAGKGSLKDIRQIRISFEQRAEKQAEEAQRKALAEELRKELDKNRVIVEALEAQRKALEELEPLFVKIRKTPKKRGSSKIRERINAMSNE